MPTWNTSKPATANSVAADVADIEENFDYLEDLLTYWFKSWSASSAAIGKNSIYYVNPGAADQGADDNARSFKDLQDTISTVKKAIFYWPHFSVDGNTTTYTFGTAETSESNITNIVEGGAILAGAGLLTLNGTMIALGDITIGNGTNGSLTVASGGKLIVFGTVTIAANSTLTIANGGNYVELGSPAIVTGTLALAGGRSSHRTLDLSTTSVTTDGTDKTTLYTYSIPANILSNGKGLRIVTSGSFSGNIAAYHTHSLTFGATETTEQEAGLASTTYITQITTTLIPYSTSKAHLTIIYDTNGSLTIDYVDLDYDVTSAVTFTYACTADSASYPFTFHSAILEVL